MSFPVFHITFALAFVFAMASADDTQLPPAMDILSSFAHNYSYEPQILDDKPNDTDTVYDLSEPKNITVQNFTITAFVKSFWLPLHPEFTIDVTHNSTVEGNSTNVSWVQIQHKEIQVTKTKTNGTWQQVFFFDYSQLNTFWDEFMHINWVVRTGFTKDYVGSAIQSLVCNGENQSHVYQDEGKDAVRLEYSCYYN